ncbi:hypothetical protein Phi47:1_gp13 [Cellulophaga phage phi47:1]|uniref:hypothetical protein n=1 Tax=Cellulophaga phage phiSM TaxID=756280 RepID=UPI0002B79552|nr:hypothetical protein CEPG_00012 [Cellulophaga phage phiSM]AGF91657.1 hypothetical protein CDPG_00053 [Cellulophaga phage phi47:1]AGO47744.1 hypothetical protein Phi3ST:2_gp13 [Cellulophaga phage phi3ST:2]AGO49252.1 hypothetical protein Phi38:2_gp13 [Cellulophaga phage phi38:2]AGO49332.1 hypothetical protein Phi3:1_gp13 [Cellulophaga phage phi3:1]AGH07760.1 hypothetical protein CEPG_00012 [Cellulophaga phage phiSM]
MKTLMTIVLTFLATCLVWWFFLKPRTDKNYIDELKHLDSINNANKVKIIELNINQLKNQIDYENNIKAIEKLRVTYPDDDVLDSLFKSGQELR